MARDVAHRARGEGVGCQKQEGAAAPCLARAGGECGSSGIGLREGGEGKMAPWPKAADTDMERVKFCFGYLVFCLVQ